MFVAIVVPKLAEVGIVAAVVIVVLAVVIVVAEPHLEGLAIVGHSYLDP